MLAYFVYHDLIHKYDPNLTEISRGCFGTYAERYLSNTDAVFD